MNDSGSSPPPSASEGVYGVYGSEGVRAEGVRAPPIARSAPLATSMGIAAKMTSNGVLLTSV